MIAKLLALVGRLCPTPKPSELENRLREMLARLEANEAAE